MNMRQKIHNATLKPRLFGTFTFKNQPRSRSDAEQIFAGFCRKLQKETGAHVKPWAGYGDDQHRPHFHAILASDEPLDINVVNALWRGSRAGGQAECSPYDPSRGGVEYIYEKHDGVWYSVFCPKRNRCCDESCYHERTIAALYNDDDQTMEHDLMA